MYAAFHVANRQCAGLQCNAKEQKMDRVRLTHHIRAAMSEQNKFHTMQSLGIAREPTIVELVDHYEKYLDVGEAYILKQSLLEFAHNYAIQEDQATLFV